MKRFSLPQPGIRWHAAPEQSIGPWGLLRGYFGRQSNIPDWPQFANADVTLTFLGRIAIHRLFEHLELQEKDEVLMPAYNCGSEIDPFLQRRIQVVLYRVGADMRIDIEDIMRRVTAKTKAVYVTH